MGKTANGILGCLAALLLIMIPALNYQNRADKLNADTKEEIVMQLVGLEQEQARLEYYVSLLDKRPQALIQAIYFDECSLDEAAK